MEQRADDMEILPMEQHNVADVFALESECFSMPWSKRSIKNELSNPLARFFVAYENDCVVGYVGMHIVLDECYITNIAVRKDNRNNGIGTNLLETAIDCAENCRARFITLEVRQSNLVAIKLYEKLGFKLQGIRKNFYESPLENGLIFTKWFVEETN